MHGSTRLFLTLFLLIPFLLLPARSGGAVGRRAFPREQVDLAIQLAKEIKDLSKAAKRSDSTLKGLERLRKLFEEYKQAVAKGEEGVRLQEEDLARCQREIDEIEAKLDDWANERSKLMRDRYKIWKDMEDAYEKTRKGLIARITQMEHELKGMDWGETSELRRALGALGQEVRTGQGRRDVIKGLLHEVEVKALRARVTDEMFWRRFASFQTESSPARWSSAHLKEDFRRNTEAVKIREALENGDREHRANLQRRDQARGASRKTNQKLRNARRSLAGVRGRARGGVLDGWWSARTLDPETGKLRMNDLDEVDALALWISAYLLAAAEKKADRLRAEGKDEEACEVLQAAGKSTLADLLFALGSRYGLRVLPWAGWANMAAGLGINYFDGKYKKSQEEQRRFGEHLQRAIIGHFSTPGEDVTIRGREYFRIQDELAALDKLISDHYPGDSVPYQTGPLFYERVRLYTERKRWEGGDPRIPITKEGLSAHFQTLLREAAAQGVGWWDLVARLKAGKLYGLPPSLLDLPVGLVDLLHNVAQDGLRQKDKEGDTEFMNKLLTHFHRYLTERFFDDRAKIVDDLVKAVREASRNEDLAADAMKDPEHRCDKDESGGDGRDEEKDPDDFHGIKGSYRSNGGAAARSALAAAPEGTGMWILLTALRKTLGEGNLDKMLDPVAVHNGRRFARRIPALLKERLAKIPEDEIARIESARFNYTIGRETFTLPVYPVSLAKERPDLVLSYLKEDFYPALDRYWTLPSLAILRAGEYRQVVDFFLKNGIYCSLIAPEELEDLLSFRTLLCPTGSLGTLAASETSRYHLESFTAVGGTVIAFTQQYGTDFRALPLGDEIGGYGWDQDQSCQFQSSLITDFHPIFAGEPSLTPSYGVDGYFTKWPSEARLLLERRLVRKPSMILYPYGSGRILATTLYADWALGHSQATAQEKRLLLALALWAETANRPLLAIAPATASSKRLRISNPTTANAAAFELVLRDAAGNEILRLRVDRAIPADTEEEVDFALPAIDAGLFSVDVDLIDGTGKSIALLPRAFLLSVARFEQKEGAATRRGSGASVTIQSASEHFERGETAHFTLALHNFKEEEQGVRVVWKSAQAGGEFHRALPPGTTEIPISFTVEWRDELHSPWFDAKMFDSSGRLLAQARKWYLVTQPDPAGPASLSTDKAAYVEGDSIRAEVRVADNAENRRILGGQWTLVDGESRVIHNGSASKRVEGGEIVFSGTIPIPADTLQGTIWIRFRAPEGPSGHARVEYRPGKKAFSGRVVNLLTGVGVADAKVRFFASEEVSTSTDAQGQFRVELPAGIHRVEITAAGHHRSATQMTLRDPKEIASLYLLPVDAASRSFVAGRIVGWGGAPIPGATLVVTNDQAGTVEFRSGRDGEYRLLLAPDRFYTVRVRLRGMDVSETIPLTRRRESALSGFDIPVTAGRVSGTIRDLMTAEALSGVRLAIDGESGSVSDVDGNYSVVLPNGIHTISVIDDRYEKTERKVLVTVRDVEEADVYVIRKEYPATVRVTDRRTGKPIPGAVVARANAILSGSPEDPLAEIHVNDELEVYRNDTLVTRLAGTSESLYLALAQGDKLRVVARTYGGSRSFAGLWLHNVETKEVLEIAPAAETVQVVSSYLDLKEVVFVEVEKEIPWALEPKVAKTGAEGEAMLTLPRGTNLLSISAEGYPHVSDALLVAGARSRLDVELRSVRRDLQVTVEGIEGARVTVPNVLLTAIPLEGPIRIYRNEELLYESKEARFFLSIRKGDKLRVEAPEGTPLWLHNLANGEKEKIPAKESWTIGEAMGADHREGVLTDAEGKAVLEGVATKPNINPSLVYVGYVLFEKKGLESRLYRAVYTPWQEEQRAWVKLLPTGTSPEGKEGTVRIRLLTTEAKPLVGYWIDILRPDGSVYLSTKWWPRNEEGTFSITLPVGAWGIGFYPNEYLHVKYAPYFETRGGEETVVDVVVPSRMGTVRVDLRDATTGKPIEMSYDFLSPHMGRRLVPLNTRDYKEFPIPAGRFGLTAGNPGSDRWAFGLYQYVHFDAYKRLLPGDRASITLELLPDFGWAHLRTFDGRSGEPKGASGYFFGPGLVPDTTRWAPVGTHGLSIGGSEWFRETFYGGEIVPIYPGRATELHIHGQARTNWGFRIAGRILDTRTGKPPVEKVRILWAGFTHTLSFPAGEIKGAWWNPYFEASLEGDRFAVRFDAGSDRQGTMTLVVEAEGYHPYERPLYLVPDREEELRIELAPKTGEKGTVRVEVKGLEGAEVRVVARDELRAAKTDSNGVAELKDLPVGPALLSVSREGYMDHTASIRIPGELKIALIPLHRIEEKTPARLEMVDSPPRLQWTAGEKGRLSIRVRNAGGEPGRFSLPLSVPGIKDRTANVSLLPGEERTVSFEFDVPQDLDDRKDEARLEIGGKIIRLPFAVQGVKVEVEASLDKTFYREGEKARLTMTVKNVGPATIDGYTRVQLGEYLHTETISIAPGKSFVHVDPVPAVFDGEKVLFGIYLKSGRSIYLNAYYLHRADEILSVAPDRQVYRHGEEVKLILRAEEAGTLTLSAPVDWAGVARTLALEKGEHTVSFTLPEPMRTDTYLLQAVFSSASGEVRRRVLLDVRGLRVKVREATMGTREYALKDTVTVALRLESSHDMPIILRSVVMSPEGKILAAHEERAHLSEGINEISPRLLYEASREGSHRLQVSVLRERAGPSPLPLADARKIVDVVDRVAPRVIEIEPSPHERVSSRAPIRIRFSEPMDPASLRRAFVLAPPAEGRLDWEETTYTLIFRPTEPLSALVHTGTISTEAADASRNRNPLAEPFSFRIGVLDPGGRMDRDGNGLPDDWEEKHGLSDPNGDPDGDGLSNLGEYKYGTDPKKADTDGDGFSDAQEIAAGTNPLDPASTPGQKTGSLRRISPMWDTVTSHREVTFSWRAEGAVRLQVASNRAFTRILADESVESQVKTIAFQTDGTYYWRIFEGSPAWRFTIDTVPATSVLFVRPAYSSLPEAISGRAEDAGSGVARIEIRITDNEGRFWDGKEWRTEERTLTIPGTTNWKIRFPTVEEGRRYRIEAMAIDRAENLPAEATAAEFRIDRTPPVSVITSPEIVSDGRVGGHAEDKGSGIEKVEALILDRDGRSWDSARAEWTERQTWNVAVGTTEWELAVPPETRKVFCRARDRAGNVESEPPQALVSFPASGPHSWITTTGSVRELSTIVGGSTGEMVEIAIEAEGLWWTGTEWGGQETWLRAEGGPRWSYPFSAEEGRRYTVYGRTEGESQPARSSFVLDATPPQVRILTREAFGPRTYGGEILLESEAGANVYTRILDEEGRLNWDGERWSPVEFWFEGRSIPFLPEAGEYRLLSYAVDAAGNTSEAQRASLRFDDRAPRSRVDRTELRRGVIRGRVEDPAYSAGIRQVEVEIRMEGSVLRVLADVEAGIWSVPIQPEGEVQVLSRALDEAGNVEERRFDLPEAKKRPFCSASIARENRSPLFFLLLAGLPCLAMGALPNRRRRKRGVNASDHPRIQRSSSRTSSSSSAYSETRRITILRRTFRA